MERSRPTNSGTTICGKTTTSRNGSPDNDSFLTVLDVFRMKIPADLVVLSACETAKGKIYKIDREGQIETLDAMLRAVERIDTRSAS